VRDRLYARAPRVIASKSQQALEFCPFSSSRISNVLLRRRNAKVAEVNSHNELHLGLGVDVPDADSVMRPSGSLRACLVRLPSWVKRRTAATDLDM
jgi:hypothetical protein